MEGRQEHQYIAYYRVSTAKQGSSGLGLEAQRQAVHHFVRGGAIRAEYTEVESGKSHTRVALDKAIAHAKETGARLVIAKLDRLSRNVAFIFALRDSGVDFVCADMPDANTLTIGIFAAMAQHERELISERTKAALQAKKQQGYVLGTPRNLTQAAREQGARQVAALARASEHNKRMCAVIENLHAQAIPIARIADFLNTSGFRTVRGKQFHGSTVRYLLQLHRSSTIQV
jgi:DNA invertase Pin-like site-specific DNA recombinase